MNIKNVKVSKKMFMVLFTIMSTYFMYYMEVAVPDSVSLALIGLVSTYLFGQSWVDSKKPVSVV